MGLHLFDQDGAPAHGRADVSAHFGRIGSGDAGIGEVVISTVGPECL